MGGVVTKDPCSLSLHLSSRHTDTFSRVVNVCERGSSFQIATISNTGRRREMKSHGNQKLIKMKLCNNTRIIHHHPSCICLQGTHYTDLNWNIILPSFELFMQPKFKPHRKTRTHTDVFASFFHLLFKVKSQNMASQRQMKDIKEPVFDTIYMISTGQSRAVHWPSLANEIGG